MRLSWSKEKRGKHWTLIARTFIGTAVVHEQPDGQATLDMWRPTQENIGRGTFANVDAAVKRAETILDPRVSAWDIVERDFLEEAG